jgi:hypothetical protein
VSRPLANGVVERAMGTHGSNLPTELLSVPPPGEARSSRLGDATIAGKCHTPPAALVGHTANTPGRGQPSRCTRRRSE